ncbi:MAG TPA: carbohydrate kinase [Gammaproteobacteria bacterium]|nr:carbohydrate kinase [Gammaproteobacteria bacterium]
MSDKNSHPIAVLALNPSLDISYEVTQLLVDQKLPSMNTRYEPGGNGINISQTLTRLDVPVNCTCIVAGRIGEFMLQLLQSELNDLHYLAIDGESRINTTMMQRSPIGQYEVDGTGPDVPETVLREIEESFLNACGQGFGIMSGSVPPGVPDDTYKQLAKSIRKQGGKAVVDAYGVLLEKVLNTKPFLLRVSQYALEMYTRKKLRKLDEVVAITRQFQQDHDLNHVCVTFGEFGALLLDSEYSYVCTPPKTHIRSTVGSGDALVAGLVAAYASGADSATALKLGVACGTATTTHAGTGLCNRDEVDRLLEELEVKCLDG